MKKTILAFIAAVFACAMLSGCQHPEEFTATRNGDALISFTASFPYEDSDGNEFKAEIDRVNHVITVVFPYNFPLNSDNVISYANLSKIRVQALTENNVIIEPALLFMDLSADSKITVIDNLEGTRTDYIVRAEIRKSAACDLAFFNLPSANISGVVAGDNISLISPEPIGAVYAEYGLPHGATIDPDPAVVALNYDEEQHITVTAQNGSDKRNYTIRKTIPPKTAAGIRPGSGALQWVKMLSSISSINTPDKVHGIAICGDKVVVNQQGLSSLPVLSIYDGTECGTFDVPAGTNFFMTSDDAGHILFCNYEEFTGKSVNIYKADGIGSTPELFITCPMSGADIGGWKISVNGDIKGDAVISTCTLRNWGTAAVEYWVVKNGALVNSEPFQKVTDLKGSNYAYWSDCVFGGTSQDSDYFVASYAEEQVSSERYVIWYDNASGSRVSSVKLWNNTVLNTVDYEEFNNARFVIYSNCNTFTWEVDKSDWIRMHDLSTGGLDNPMSVIPESTYGAQPSGKANPKGFSDALMAQSSNGYYLYVYFYFAGGQIGCVRYDCFE